jgi:hypothetical protein
LDLFAFFFFSVEDMWVVPNVRARPPYPYTLLAPPLVFAWLVAREDDGVDHRYVIQSVVKAIACSFTWTTRKP